MPNKRASKKLLVQEIAPLKAIKKPSEAERQKLGELEKRLAELRKRIPTTLVSTSVEPRVMRVLPRGNWLNETGEVVLPGVPAALPGLTVKKARATRLDLARWLVSRQNPLPARVMVNRLWKLFFGQGLVTTMDDFGSQGAWPSHPELLDWLASRVHRERLGREGDDQEDGDVGDVSPELECLRGKAAARPGKSLAGAAEPIPARRRAGARQCPFALRAAVREDRRAEREAVSAAGILGLSQFPEARLGRRTTGPNRYRRGLYTYWQRMFLHPSLLAFDASTREECVVERPRSNTPLQALVLLNDPTYVEAARAFAARMIREGGADPTARIERGFQLALSRRRASASGRS